jgi:hypothetical protein
MVTGWVVYLILYDRLSILCDTFGVWVGAKGVMGLGRSYMDAYGGY